MAESSISDRLRALGILLEEVAGDLVAMSALPALGGRLQGPEVPALDAHVAGVYADLVDSHHELANTVARLRTLREPYLERQVEALRLGPAPRELLLSLTGRAPTPWITIGFPPARVVMNLRWGLPFPDGSARLVYFALALEHFYFEPHALAIVRDVRRVLAPDGVVRIVVPDLGKYMRAYAAGDDAFFTGHRDHWGWARHMQTPMDYLQGMSGNGRGRGPGGFFDHKMGYDFATLADLLKRAGFATVEESAYMTSATEELRLDHISNDAGFAHGDQNYNLFVEAHGLA